MSTQNSAEASASQKRGLTCWNNDNVRDKPSSIQILIDWLTNAANYSCWKGRNSSRKTKETLCSEIKAIMVENDITHRSNSDIHSKIQYLHDKFKDATDFINGISQEILNDVDKNGNPTAAAEKMLRALCLCL
ncbi:hypothetical protein F4703DRAFT_1798526 [Phycomyces blakesleeanus]